MTDYADFPQGTPAAQASAPTLTKLEKEDILSLENSFLKIQNLKLQGDKLQADLLKCNEMMQAEQNKLREMRDNLSKRFGIDLAAAQILADGTIIPKKD